MKKILFIHHATGWGGAPINMINVINALDKSKFNIEVLLLKNSVVSKKLEINNIDYTVVTSFFYKHLYKYYSHTEPSHIKWFKFCTHFRVIISWILSRHYFAPKELKKHDFDIVHLNSSVLTDWLAPCRKRGKVVYHIQEPLTMGDFGLRFRYFRYLVKKYVDQIIAISDDNAKRINLPEITSVVYNFTEICQKEINIGSYSSKKVLYVGGDAYIKGYYTLVEALDFLDNDIVVLFAGNFTSSSSNFKRQLKLLIPKYRGKVLKQEKALHKIYECENAINVGLQDSISSLLDQVCLLVSPFSVEHFSRPIIEAFAHSKAIVATNIIGIEEIVMHNYNGIIVERNNPKDLADAINYLTKNPSLCKEFGENGFKLACKLFTDKNVLKIEEIYSKL